MNVPDFTFGMGRAAEGPSGGRNASRDLGSQGIDSWCYSGLTPDRAYVYSDESCWKRRVQSLRRQSRERSLTFPKNDPLSYRIGSPCGQFGTVPAFAVRLCGSVFVRFGRPGNRPRFEGKAISGQFDFGLAGLSNRAESDASVSSPTRTALPMLARGDFHPCTAWRLGRSRWSNQVTSPIYPAADQQIQRGIILIGLASFCGGLLFPSLAAVLVLCSSGAQRAQSQNRL